MRHRFSLGFVLLGFASGLAFGPPANADEAGDAFEKHIRPMLLEKCIECHGPSKQENNVRLDRRSDVLNGKSGEVAFIVPGNPDASRLWQVIQHHETDVAMPPSGKLPPEQIEFVRQWIISGAVWPETMDLEGDAKKRAERWREHWAFQPVREPDLAQVPSGVQPVDYYIRKALADKGLAPSAAAPHRVLVRRLSYAIIGLPPELAELKAADDAVTAGQWDSWKSAYIDRLLNSPHFGERWARFWMDVSRYADTKGYVFQEDREYHEAWKYREWIIKSLNADMPYDEFLKRQLAADQMPGSDDPGQLAAMGFLTLGRRFLNNPHDIIDDRIDVVSRGLLGLTVSCSRCHDHKFDPISIGDYYSLYGVFASSEEPKNEPSTLRMVDRPDPVEPVIFLRGQPHNRGDKVPRRFLTALAGPDAAPFQKGSGRLELAESIASRDNPLTSRVFVNRIWAQLFGRGFVDTPSDFGVRTERPAHAELLNYLAWDFVHQNWSMKALVRRLVTSQTWQQSSDRREDAEQIDPENRLLARMNRTRLDFEALRDSVVAASGRLDKTIGGPSTDLANDPNVVRRAVYARIDRQNLPGLFRTFDLASPDTHAPKRFQTIIPQQALFQLNSAFTMNRAAEISQRTSSAGNDADVASRVRELFLIVLQREPSNQEMTEAVAFVRQMLDEQARVSRSGWEYGYGAFRESDNTVTKFQRLPIAKEGKLQAGETLPDPTLGWVFLSKAGGHTGNSVDVCAIRRWTADSACRVLIHGVVSHPSDQGDGVRVRVIGPGSSLLADAVAQNSTSPFAVKAVDLEAGQSIDFVIDCRTNSSHDSFNSRFVLTQSSGGKVARVWKSDEDFRETTQERMDAWAQLAQVLLMSNEFAFVD